MNSIINNTSLLSDILFNNECIKFDISDIYTRYYEYRNIFKELINIEKNDKIGFDENNIIYLNKNSKFQHIIRWYYSQDRQNTRNKLSEILDEYKIFNDMIIFSIYNKNTNVNEIQSIDLRDKLVSLNKIIIDGLEILYNTYHNISEETCNIIKKYIDIMKKSNQNIINNNSNTNSNINKINSVNKINPLLRDKNVLENLQYRI